MPLTQNPGGGYAVRLLIKSVSIAVLTVIFTLGNARAQDPVVNIGGVTQADTTSNGQPAAVPTVTGAPAGPTSVQNGPVYGTPPILVNQTGGKPIDPIFTGQMPVDPRQGQGYYPYPVNPGYGPSQDIQVQITGTPQTGMTIRITGNPAVLAQLVNGLQQWAANGGNFGPGGAMNLGLPPQVANQIFNTGQIPVNYNPSQYPQYDPRMYPQAPGTTGAPQIATGPAAPQSTGNGATIYTDPPRRSQVLEGVIGTDGGYKVRNQDGTYTATNPATRLTWTRPATFNPPSFTALTDANTGRTTAFLLWTSAKDAWIVDPTTGRVLKGMTLTGGDNWVIYSVANETYVPLNNGGATPATNGQTIPSTNANLGPVQNGPAYAGKGVDPIYTNPGQIYTNPGQIYTNPGQIYTDPGQVYKGGGIQKYPWQTPPYFPENQGYDANILIGMPNPYQNGKPVGWFPTPQQNPYPIDPWQVPQTQIPPSQIPPWQLPPNQGPVIVDGGGKGGPPIWRDPPPPVYYPPVVKYPPRPVYYPAPIPPPRRNSQADRNANRIALTTIAGAVSGGVTDSNDRARGAIIGGVAGFGLGVLMNHIGKKQAYGYIDPYRKDAGTSLMTLDTSTRNGANHSYLVAQNGQVVTKEGVSVGQMANDGTLIGEHGEYIASFY